MNKELTNEQIAAGAAVKGDNGKPIGRNVAIDVFDAMCAAADDKAAEEGGLPACPDLPKETAWFDNDRMHFEFGEPEFRVNYYNLGQMLDYARAYARLCIAADRASRQVAIPTWQERSVGPDALGLYPDAFACMQAEIAELRASRQVANKAEVEPVAFMTSDKKMLVFADAMRKLQFDQAGMVALYDTPPATTGASTALRPTDDDLWDATLRDRDAYHEWADKLADAIATHFGVDIGEHSNQNLPWDEALQAIENAEPVGASTVLTDAQVDDMAFGYAPSGKIGELRELIRAVESKVAAQASQIAVPEWIDADDQLPEDDACVMALIYPYNNKENEKIAVQGHYFDGTFMNREGDDLHPPTHWMPLPAAPSPAKELK